MPKAVAESTPKAPAAQATRGRATKVRRTLTLDPEIVAEFEGDEAGLSAAVNLALKETVERRARRRQLAAFLDELEAIHGAPDPAAVERFARHMRG